MLIKSQDGNTIFMFGANSYITIRHAGYATNYFITAVTRDDEFDLAEYSTEKKARMILDEILQKYVGCYRAFEMPADGEV